MKKITRYDDQITFKLSKELKEAALEACRNKKEPVSEVLRHCLEKYVKQNK